MRSVRFLLTFAVVVLLMAPVSISAQNETYWPTKGWRTSTPESQGMDSVLLAKFLDDMVSVLPTPFHSIVIIRHGNVVLDASPYPYSSAKPQAFRDTVDTVMATLIGIAIDKGYLKGVDQSVWDFLPKAKTANMNADKAAFKIEDFLTHRSGLDFSEGMDFEKLYPLGANDPAWVQTFLDAKTVTAPGTGTTRWFYGDGLVLSAILQKATGMTTLEFAKQNLFGPLGITDVTWLADPQGVTIGDDEIYLSPLDMAKIVYLYLHNGQWEGKTIVSEAFVKKATSKVTLNPAGGFEAFGYGWNVYGSSTWRGLGQATPGGEQFGALPELDLIYMVTGDTNFRLGSAFEYLAGSIQGFGSSRALENPDAAAKLEAAAQALANPVPRKVVAVPDAFNAISGKTFKLEDNQAGWQTLTVDLAGPGAKEATLTLGISNTTVKLAVGTDFVYRISPTGLPAQPGSGAYRLRGDLPWMARLNWAPNGSELYVWMGDLAGRENWLVDLSYINSRLHVRASVEGLGFSGSRSFTFNGTAS